MFKLSFIFSFLAINVFTLNIISQLSDSSNIILGDIIQDYLVTQYPNELFSDFLYIGINRQKLYCFSDSKLKDVFSVSTSESGAGNLFSSNKTPTGLHLIKDKIGENAPIGTLFKNKKNTGKVVKIHNEQLENSIDEITSRVLVLSGKESGVNKGKKVDTFARCIYIHGTSDEESIGKPKSHGCVRMRNSDVINLFDVVNEGMLVVLIDN